MFKLRLPFLIMILITPLCATLLWIALAGAIPAQAAPLQTLDENTTIISVTHLALGARDIISDPLRHVLYASLPSAVGAGGNRIVPIAVPTGTLRTSLFVGSEPDIMALSHDGQFLYVGINGANSVRRVNLNTYSADIQISLGPGGFCGGYVAHDMVVLQDDPHAVAVAKNVTSCSPGDAGVTIFDDATARPVSTDNSYPQFNSIEPSSSPSILYGYSSNFSEGFSTLVITPTGISISTTNNSVLSGYGIVAYENGLLYSSSGHVVDSQTNLLVGTYAGSGPFALDSSNGIVYMAELGDFDTPDQLVLFSQAEFTKIKALRLYNINTAYDYSGRIGKLILIDSHHLALLTTTGHLYLITLGERVALPPTFGSQPNLATTEGIQYTYTVSATDPNYGDNVVISTPLLPDWLYFDQYSSPNLTGYPYRDDVGANPVKFLVTDSEGLTSTQEFVINVAINPDFKAPTFTSTPNLTATVDSAYLYDITTQDENAGQERFISALEQPNWLDVDSSYNGTAILSGTPAQTDVGAHAVTLQVRDSNGLTSTQQFTVAVLAAPGTVAPSFGSTPSLAATKNITYTYLITANPGQPGDLLAFSAPVLPSWLTLTPLVNGATRLSGAPSAADIGAHLVTLMVTDTHGLGDLQQFTVVVSDTPGDVPPTIGSAPLLGAAEGMTYTYIITASDPDVGDLLAFSAPVRPSWLTLTPLVNGAASLSGVAANGDIGANAVTLWVTDSQGLSDTQSFTVTVVAVGQVEGVLFDDQNGNGTQENGEAGIAGAMATLTPSTGSIAAQVLQQAVITTTTASDGAYQFNHVPTGDYALTFDVPGDGPNPPSRQVEVTGSAPVVVAPIALAPNNQSLYLPNVNKQQKAQISSTR